MARIALFETPALSLSRRAHPARLIRSTARAMSAALFASFSQGMVIAPLREDETHPRSFWQSIGAKLIGEDHAAERSANTGRRFAPWIKP